MTIHFKHSADGFGFRYGYADIGGDFPVRVEAMPPEPLWQGTHRLERVALPDPTRWAVFMDGEEVGRVSTEAEVAPLIEQQVASLRSGACDHG